MEKKTKLTISGNAKKTIKNIGFTNNFNKNSVLIPKKTKNTQNKNSFNRNFFVIYGDSYLRFKLKNLKIDKKISTMAIFKNNNKYDKSNVELKRSSYIVYHEKKNKKKFNYIDYGNSYLNKNIFKNYKKNVKFDLSSLFQDISKKNMLKGYKLKKRFYEIRSYAGINELTKFIKK